MTRIAIPKGAAVYRPSYDTGVTARRDTPTLKTLGPWEKFVAWSRNPTNSPMDLARGDVAAMTPIAYPHEAAGALRYLLGTMFGLPVTYDATSAAMKAAPQVATSMAQGIAQHPLYNLAPVLTGALAAGVEGTATKTSNLLQQLISDSGDEPISFVNASNFVQQHAVEPTARKLGVAGIATMKAAAPIARHLMPQAMKDALPYDMRAYLHLLGGTGTPLEVSLPPEMQQAVRYASKRPNIFGKGAPLPEDLYALKAPARTSGIPPSAWETHWDFGIATSGQQDSPPAMFNPNVRAHKYNAASTPYKHTFGRHYIAKVPSGAALVGDTYAMFPSIQVLQDGTIGTSQQVGFHGDQLHPSLLPPQDQATALFARIADALKYPHGAAPNLVLQDIGNLVGKPYPIFARVPPEGEGLRMDLPLREWARRQGFPVKGRK